MNKYEETLAQYATNLNDATIAMEVEKIVRDNCRLTPDGIIETLGLRDTTYKQTAKYGHFGIEGLPWEKTDKVDDLKKYIKS